MIHLAPRRLAGMIDNALAAVKQGNKPHPYLLLLALHGKLTASGIGQYVMVEDAEPDMEGPEDGVAIPLKEAEAVAKTIRGTEGALRKDHTVFASIRDGVFRVENGNETIVEVADLGEEADEAWGFRADHQQYYGEPVTRGSRYDLFDNSILAVLGKLKPASAESRILLYPHHAAETMMFRLDTIRGFCQGNTSDPVEDLTLDLVFE